MSESITHFGVLIPISLPINHTYTECPIPEPEPDCLTVVKHGDTWALLWTLADEDDMAPEASVSINWINGAAQGVGPRHILAHGYQFGEYLLTSVTRDTGDPLPDTGDIQRYDWTSKLSPP